MHREAGHKKVETETGVTLPPTKEHQEAKGFSLEAIGGGMACSHLGSKHLASRTMKKGVSIVLRNV